MTFKGYAWFELATFNNARFSGVTFEGDARFTGVTFEGEGAATAKALKSLGISMEAVRQRVEEIIGQGQQGPDLSAQLAVLDAEVVPAGDRVGAARRAW